MSVSVLRFAIRAARHCAVAALILLATVSASSAAQRMLLLPSAAPISIAPHQSALAEARCLDVTESTPRNDDLFTAAPAALNSATVSVDGGAPIPLQSAIDQNIITIKGANQTENVEIESLVDKSLSVDIGLTSVIAPDDNKKTDDLLTLAIANSKSVDLDQNAVWDASEIAQVVSRGWTEQEILDSGASAGAILELYRRGWSTDEIKPLGRSTIAALDILDYSDWTKSEIQAFPVSDWPAIVRLAGAYLEPDDVRSLKVGLSEAADLVERDWSLDDINALDKDVDAAVTLAKTGLSPEGIRDLGQETVSVAAVADWTGTKANAGLNEASFYTLLRLKDGDASRYILFSPDGSAATAIGNTNLDTVVSEVRRIEDYRGSTLPPQIVLTGQGDSGDFDAIQMTIADVDAGGGKGRAPLNFISAPPDFPPRNNGSWDKYNGHPEDLPVAYFPDGKRTKLVRFLTRGSVVLTAQAFLYEKWPAMMAFMRLGVRDAEAAPGAATLPPKDVVDLIESRIERRLSAAKAAEGIEGFPEGAFGSETTIDAAPTKVRRYADLGAADTVKVAAAR